MSIVPAIAIFKSKRRLGNLKQEQLVLERSARLNDHLQMASTSRWSFARGRILQMIICKRPVPPDDHLQIARPSGWSFARGRILRMIICKRPVPPDDHLQEARSSGWLFARRRIPRMIICKRPVHRDNHLVPPFGHGHKDGLECGSYGKWHDMLQDIKKQRRPKIGRWAGDQYTIR